MNTLNGYSKSTLTDNYVLTAAGGHLAVATAGTTKPWNSLVSIGTDGVSEIGRYIDFHHDNTTGSDYSTRLQSGGNYNNVITLPSSSGTLALTSQIPTITNYYWADVKVSDAKKTDTSPTFAYPTSIYSQFTNGSSIIGYVGKGGSTDNLYFINYTNSDICLSTDNTTNKGIYIKTGGNIGIGITDPKYKLHVSGLFYSSGGAKFGDIQINMLENGNNSSGVIECFALPLHLNYYSSKNVVTNIGGGNLGVGTTSIPYKLTVKGSVGATSFVNTTSSDSYVLLGGGGTQPLGNSSGSIPLNNGVLNTTLNADLLDDLHKQDFKYVNDSNRVYTLNLSGTAGGIGSSKYYKLSISKLNNKWTMFLAELSVKERYDTYNFGKLFLHFNKDASNNFSGPRVVVLGPLTSSIKVYFINSTTLDIYIGGDWNWPTISIDKITFGDSAASTANKEFTLTIADSLPSGLIEATKTVLVDSNNYASYLGYIGTTAVQKSSGTLNLTGIGSITNTGNINTGGNIIFSPTAGATIGTSYSTTNLNRYNFIKINSSSEGILYYSGGWTSSDHVAHSFITKSDNTTRMVIMNTTGNVGIGTSSPGLKLQVEGHIALFESLDFTRDNWNYITAPANSGNLSFNIGVAGTTNTKMCILNNGNVGINTTSPAQKLHVSGSVAISTYLFMPDNNSNYHTTIDRSGNTILFGYGHGVAGYDVYYTGKNVHLNAAGGWATNYNLTLLANGNVGIGTYSPTLKLEVTLTIKAARFMSNNVMIECDSTGASGGCGSEINNFTTHLYLLHHSANNVYLASGGGNVGIGQTSANYKLDVGGTLNSYNYQVGGAIELKTNDTLCLTTVFGSNNSGYRMRIVRQSTANGLNTQYSPTLVVSSLDTHAYFAWKYYDAQAWIGGGSGNKWNWRAELITSANIADLAVYYVKDKSNGNKITFHYSDSGFTSNPSWLAAWNNYDLTYVSPSVLSVNYAASAGSVAWSNVSGRPDMNKYVSKNFNNIAYSDITAKYMGGTTPTYYRITFPDRVISMWNMVNMEIFVRQSYDSEYGGKILICTHNNGGNTWNPFRASTHGPLTTSIKVYGSGGKYLYIGGCGAYSTISIDKILIGDTAANYDISDISIDYVTSLPSTYQTATMYYDINSLNIGSQSVNYAASAGSVAWSNVSGRPSSLPANGGNADTTDGVHLEWAGSQAASSTAWLAGWTSDGTKLKAVKRADLSVNYASSAGNADTVDNYHASSFAKIGTYNNLTHAGNEFTFASAAFSGEMWINYRTASGSTNGNITKYNFGNGKGGVLASISSGYFSGTAAAANSVAWGNITGKPTIPSFGAKGSTTQGVYLSGTNTFATMTYSLKSTVNGGTASKLAYYSGANAISAYSSTVGSSHWPTYMNAGVPTKCSSKYHGTCSFKTGSSGYLYVYQFGPIVIILGYITKVALSDSSTAVFTLPSSAPTPCDKVGFCIVQSSDYDYDRNLVLYIDRSSSTCYQMTSYNNTHPAGEYYPVSLCYMTASTS